MSILNQPVESLSGVGKARAAQLKKLNIYTIHDLLYHFPRAYENRGNTVSASCAIHNEFNSLLLTVATEPHNALIKKGTTITKFRAFDESGTVEIVFFNTSYAKSIFHVGSMYRFYGKIIENRGKLQLVNPKYEPYIEGLRLADFTPIYPLTEGLSSKVIEKIIKKALDDYACTIEDHLSDDIRISEHLPPLKEAIRNIHFPKTRTDLSISLQRLAFDEMLSFGLGIAITNSQKIKSEGIPFNKISLDQFLNSLPFELTESQKQAVNDIYRDLVIKDANGRISPMARILIGDVGSGKTVCAEIAIFISVASGYQSALMVPTEILAVQHYNEISDRFEKLGYKVALLTGSKTKKEKEEIYQGLENGTIDIVVGTHAILSENTVFKKLGLVITDEQHRFGVKQRRILKDKQKSAHMLVMSATPIPRTLALAMYGDLDVTKITQAPKGRQRVDTYVVDESYRNRLNSFIASQVSLGGQCYVVCPAIEKKEDEGGVIPESISVNNLVYENNLNLKNAVEHANTLSNYLNGISVSCLHGKMSPREKDEIMKQFERGEIKVLVSTTVIEVGVNVPNASLMIVENAERFGLAQLHQLRGRVGRGSRKSYCVLVSDIKTGTAKSRLDIMKTTYNGFTIAEKDLELRGPGDFFSSNCSDNLRQSGGFEFKLASKCDDIDLINRAFRVAKNIIKDDPSLEKQENILIREMIKNSVDLNISNIS